MRQDLVFDIDELERLLRRIGIDRGDRRHGMAVIERLLARHAVDQHVIHGLIAIGEIRQIRAGDDRLHAGKLLGLRRVDLDDLGMRMRRTQHAAYELARRESIGAVTRTARHLVNAVGTQRPGADDFEFLAGKTGVISHVQAPLISRAASWTARTILS